MSSKKRRNEIIQPIVPILFDKDTQTNDKDKDKEKKDTDTEKDIERESLDVYDDKDIEYIKNMKKKSIVLYDKWMESKRISLSRTITLKDILTLSLSNEKRATLLEMYECLKQLAPYTQEYIDGRNMLKNLYNRFSSKKPVTDDLDVEMFKNRLSELTLSTENRIVIDEKIDEFQDSEKGDEKIKLKRWLSIATSLPFDKLTPIEYDVNEKLEHVSSYLDEMLYGMKNVKERLLIFLNKKLRSNTKGCNIALIGKPGVGKCVHPDTPIRMADLSIKLAKHVCTDDYLMGDDSSTREVTSIVKGRQEMYKIVQDYGCTYTVNKSHILTLYRKRDKMVIDIPIVDVIGNEFLYIPINGYYNGNINANQDAISYALLFSGKDHIGHMPAHFPLLPPYVLEWRLYDKMLFYEMFIDKDKNYVYVAEPYPIDSIIGLLQSAGVRCKRENRFIVFIPDGQFETFRIVPIGEGDYCGFTITGNERFLLGDWTVTHNTAIAKCLSKCLHIPFSQVSFGGVTNPEFLLGHDYTYIGSRPGEITRCLSRMGTKNGILFFDEFDKASERKEIMSTLLHITDFSQNNEFRDNYFPELCQDLSRIWFIYSMNELPKDPAMLDRLEIIKIDDYDVSDKKMIVKNYLLPKYINELGLQDLFTIDEKAMSKIIGNHKSGVRDIERMITILIEKIYFFVCNMNSTYKYDWFLKMKDSFKNGMLTISEDLINIVDNTEPYSSMYS